MIATRHFLNLCFRIILYLSSALDLILKKKSRQSSRRSISMTRGDETFFTNIMVRNTYSLEEQDKFLE